MSAASAGASHDVGSRLSARRGTRSPGRLAKLTSLVIPAGLVAGSLVLLAGLRYGAETAVADLVSWLPVGYAFGAGMVASVNPCGFMLLPSYLSYYLGTEEEGFYEQTSARRFLRALLLGGVATAGFLVVLLIVGAVIAAGGRWLTRVFPYAGVAIGGVMVLLGVWLLATHRTLGVVAASRVAASPGRSLRSVFSYGVAYALGSLSCTLPIFLVVVGTALASRDLVASFVQFVGYALGMGATLIVVSVGAALFRGAAARWLRGLVPHVHRMSAMFLVGAGVYLVYYWVFISGSFG